MNIIRMTGGMGNQMFQYALYLKLCSLGREVKFDDISEYDRPNVRPIMLWAFGIDYPRASKDEINEITDGFLKFSHRVRRKLFGRRSKEYYEGSCNFNEQVLVREPAYLTGYFQSEKYFKDIEGQVREAFTFSGKMWEGLDSGLKERMEGYLKRIQSAVSVAVHIRRGDYLEKEEIYGGICTEEYYEQAIKMIKEEVPDARFYIFSDDAAYVKGKYQGEDYTVVDINHGRDSFYDIWLMSNCRHNICANSTFSFWGARLNENEDKIMIRPTIHKNSQIFVKKEMEELWRGWRFINPKGQIQ